MAERKLRVFICHGIHNNEIVLSLYRHLIAESWIIPWLEDEDLLPGQDRELEIEKTLESTDVALICISRQSSEQEGYIQREIDSIIRIAQEKLRGSIFIIPIRLDDCEIPRSLRPWKHVDLNSYEIVSSSYKLLLKSMERRLDTVSGKTAKTQSTHWVSSSESKVVDDLDELTFSGFTFVKISKGKFKMGSRAFNDLAGGDEHPQWRYDISYNYWILRFPISNEQFSDYAVSTRHIAALSKDWKKSLKQPIVNVSWHDAVEYTIWLNKIFKNEIPDSLIFRLPTEVEWEKASRGNSGAEWPWGDENLDDYLNKETPELLERLKKKNHLDEDKHLDNFAEFHANFSKANSAQVENDPEKSVLDSLKKKLVELRKNMKLVDVGTFSPVTDSPYGVADMMGSVWEWTHSLYKPYPYDVDDGRENPDAPDERVIRGYFSPNSERFSVRSAKRARVLPNMRGDFLGFRIVVAPPIS